MQEPLTTHITFTNQFIGPLFGILGSKKQLDLLSSFEFKVNKGEQKREMLSGGYGTGKSAVANRFKEKIEKDYKFEETSTMVYLKTENGKLTFSDERNTTINLFNSNTFFISNATILSLYMALTFWIYIESTTTNQKTQIVIACIKTQFFTPYY